MKKLPTSKKFKIYKKTRRELSDLFPDAFPRTGKRPALKVGILDDLKAIENLESSITNCRIFLRIWTNSTAYLKSISKKQKRKGLRGENCNEVLISHINEAKKQLNIRINRRTG